MLDEYPVPMTRTRDGSWTAHPSGTTASRSGQVPEALRCLEQGFAAATQFYAFPKAHWVRIRSTNGLERLHGEKKRRTRSVGAFPGRQSALRLTTAVDVEKTQVWSDRRYLDMALLKNTMEKRAIG